MTDADFAVIDALPAHEKVGLVLLSFLHMPMFWIVTVAALGVWVWVRWQDHQERRLAAEAAQVEELSMRLWKAHYDRDHYTAFTITTRLADMGYTAWWDADGEDLVISVTPQTEGTDT